MSEYAILSGLLLAHFVADYPLQTNWMAQNKHDKDIALFVHTLVHTVTTFAFVYALSGMFHGAVGFACFIFVSHFLIDASELHIRWDQTAHIGVIVVLWFGIVVL
jgi:hypothetical protein